MKNNVILGPIISEKSTKHAANHKFTFLVLKDSDKTMIKHAVEDQFKVKVLGIATSIVKGKTKRVGARRSEVKISVWKKATVTLPKDQKISWFDVAGAKKV